MADGGLRVRFGPINGLIEVGAVRRGCEARRGRLGHAKTSCGGESWPAQGSAAACSGSARREREEGEGDEEERLLGVASG